MRISDILQKPNLGFASWDFLVGVTHGYPEILNIEIEPGDMEECDIAGGEVVLSNPNKWLDKGKTVGLSLAEIKPTKIIHRGIKITEFPDEDIGRVEWYITCK